jgi:hypothetical protein
MTERKKLKRDIDGLNNSIRLDWVNLASKNLSATDRAGIRQDIAFLMEELAALATRLDELDRHARIRRKSQYKHSLFAISPNLDRTIDRNGARGS